MALVPDAAIAAVSRHEASPCDQELSQVALVNSSAKPALVLEERVTHGLLDRMLRVGANLSPVSQYTPVIQLGEWALDAMPTESGLEATRR
jgi:hypothetical protein